MNATNSEEIPQTETEIIVCRVCDNHFERVVGDDEKYCSKNCEYIGDEY